MSFILVFSSFFHVVTGKSRNVLLARKCFLFHFAYVFFTHTQFGIEKKKKNKRSILVFTQKDNFLYSPIAVVLLFPSFLEKKLKHSFQKLSKIILFHFSLDFKERTEKKKTTESDHSF